jgi:hypothetical protein
VRRRAALADPAVPAGVVRFDPEEWRVGLVASPGPAAADGIAPLVVELLAMGAGDVELERGGWRLRVHPR